MLEVFVEDSLLDLPAATISLTQTNPLLDKDGIGRAFSFPFSAPVSPRNAHLLGHRHRLDAAKVAGKKPGRIRFMAHDIFTGFVTEQKSSNARMELAFTNDVLDIWKKLGEFKISEILEEIDTNNAFLAPAVWDFQLVNPPSSYTLKIEGNIFNYASLPGDTRDVCGAAITALINATYPGMATYTPGVGKMALDSAIVNNFPVDTNYSYVGMTLSSMISVGQRAHDSMAAFVDDVVTNGHNALVFAPVRWDAAYAEPVPGFSGTINAYANSDLTDNTPTELEGSWTTTVCPFVKLSYILEKIRLKVGLDAWTGSVSQLTDFQQLIVVNNLVLDKSFRDWYSDGKWKYLNGYQRKINLNKHVPDMGAADFLRAICTTFNLLFELDGKAPTFVRRADAMTKPVSDWTKFASPEYTLDRVAELGWLLDYAKSDAEKFSVAGQLLPKSSGGAKAETRVARTFFEASVSFFGTAKLPRTEQPVVANKAEQSDAKSSLPLTLLFYRGLQNTSSATPYPFATHGTTNQAGASVGTYSLDISGTAGLYEKWHRGIIELSDSDTLNLSFRLPLGEVQRASRWQNARVRVNHPGGAFTAAVKALKYSLSENGLSVVEAELLRL